MKAPQKIKHAELWFCMDDLAIIYPNGRMEYFSPNTGRWRWVGAYRWSWSEVARRPGNAYTFISELK